MKMKNDQQWSLQEQAFSQDETGKQFINYFTFWLDTAERLLDEELVETGDGTPARPLSPYEAINRALEITEGVIGNMDAQQFMGQMLAFMIANWVHGDELANQLSNLELKLTMSAVQQRAEQMQMMAEENSQEPV